VNLLQILFSVAGALGFVMAVGLFFHERGYTAGFKEGKDSGYLAGRKAADNWWLGVEAEADRARQEIGREGTNKP